MEKFCTIYCKTKSLEGVRSLLRQQFLRCSSDSLADECDAWVVHGGEGTLRVTAKWFCEGGDEFCRLMLSTIAFIEGLSNADPMTKSRLTSHVESCELVLGVVATPSFDSDERYREVVFRIASELDGIIFDGEEMLDASGETLS